MPSDQQHRHRRRSIRLPGHNYSGEGPYFVTICTHQRSHLFGDIDEDAVALNRYGRIVEQEWLRSADLRPGVFLDAFVIMPNHFHALVDITDGRDDGEGEAVGAHSCAPLQAGSLRPAVRFPRSLASFIAQFKASATRRINTARDMPGTRVWQRNYYEHIVRDENDYWAIREYIADNPRRWAEDEYYSAGARPAG